MHLLTELLCEEFDSIIRIKCSYIVPILYTWNIYLDLFVKVKNHFIISFLAVIFAIVAMAMYYFRCQNVTDNPSHAADTLTPRNCSA